MEIKSGQKLWMWTSNHWSFPKNRDKIIQLSTRYDPIILEDVILKTTQEIFHIVPKHMRSLMEYDMMMYPPYTENEIQFYLPSRITP